jgi:hypothetical protein
VSVPEIGSRDGLFCLGGIWGCHADLRREWFGGISIYSFFGFWAVVHVELLRRGDTYAHFV